MTNENTIKKRINVKYKNKPCYDIIIGDNFSYLKNEIIKLNVSNRKICIVTESNVGPLYLEIITEIIRPLCRAVVSFQFEAGEARKNLDTVNELYEFLIKNKFDRNDILIALGGGVTGDMTGFAAATYLRGIDYIQIPTSLLSQVDSSIGGKTGVDYKAYKNMVGAFKQPRLVYISLDTLRTLPEREYLSGMGEIIKHGLIKDRDYFEWIKTNVHAINSRELSALGHMIEVSCNIKRGVVERDPKEKGERGLLNFGHTFGHAIEKLMNFSLLHGECVAIGMAGALYISYKKGALTASEYKDILECIKEFNLPTTFSGISVENIIEATYNDKKMDSGAIKFIVLDSVGDAAIDRTVSEDLMKEALSTIKFD